jgi:hypothetical protein
MILVAAIVAQPAPASAITPRQCEVLSTSFLKLMKYQSNVLDQSDVLLQQRLTINGLVLSMMDRHPDLTNSDFEEFEKVEERVVDAAATLNSGRDLAARKQLR